MGAIRAGLLREIIIIKKPVIITNEYGEEVTTYKFKYRTRARLIHTTGGRGIQNSEIFYDYIKLLEVRRYVEIDEFDRIEWNDREYRVLDIEPNGGQQMKTIKIQLVND